MGDRGDLVRVKLVLQAPHGALALPGLRVQTLPPPDTAPKFDWLFNLWDGPDGITGSLQFDADRFEAARVRWALGLYTHLLEALCTLEPAATVGDWMTRAARAHQAAEAAARPTRVMRRRLSGTAPVRREAADLPGVSGGPA
jgi:hypothetical protein